jgi:hypothetical protein
MKTTNKMITMKSIYILAAFLGLHFNTIFAAGNFSEASASLTSSTLVAISTGIAPVSPKEATFEDGVELNSETAVNETTTSILAPITPAEAEFEDEPDGISGISVRALAPITPADADFEDHI